VTVLFCDVVGSTAFGELVDPEALQGLLARYFERMSGIVESHGGSVEKFIGDAVMAVFGVPVAHEDDALRACRAAIEMRDAFPELGIAGRIGVNTGEVVTGTEAATLATGDAVNTAKRLEQGATGGEILIGMVTERLVRHWDAEHGHHGVTDEFLDRAAVRLDDPLHPHEVAREQPLQCLRINRLPQCRRAPRRNGGKVRRRRRYGRLRAPAGTRG